MVTKSIEVDGIDAVEKTPDVSTGSTSSPAECESDLKLNDTSKTTDNDKSKSDDSDSDSKKPKLSRGSVCETKLLVSRYGSSGEETIERDSAKLNISDAPHAEFAIVSTEAFDEDNKFKGTTLEINSPQVLAALKDTVKYYPGEALDFSRPIKLKYPYKLVYHYRTQLQQYAESADEISAAHIALLLQHLRNELGEDGLQLETSLGRGLVAFRDLWAIFTPGDLVHLCQYGHDRICRLEKTGYGEHKTRGLYFDAQLLYTSYDGTAVGRSIETCRIYEKEEFVGNGPTNITRLSVRPLSIYPEEKQESLKAAMIERGEQYLQIREMQVMQYDGLYLYLKRPPHDFYNENSCYRGSWLPETAVGRVMIDPKTFIEESRAQKEEWIDEESDTSKDGVEPQKHDHFNDFGSPLLCPPHVFGFSFEKKEWCKLFITCLRPVDWRPNALDQLILPAQPKRLIQGLISSHRYPDKARNETGLKGKGLVMLLHGSPGAGKTLTAEMTAEHTHRPLLSISTGELGSWEWRISTELKRLLTYASIWQAIVLIDEADVFLEARKSGPSEQLEQNAMVAVFLRQLEYFQGIIFLTSNRVQVFDPAIKSRIHLALQYKDPDVDVRRALWAQFIQAVPKSEKDTELCPGEAFDCGLDKLKTAPMNGREIANAVNTARTLATDEKALLSFEHLQAIVDVWSEFEDTVQRIQKTSVEAAEREAIMRV